MATPSLMWMAHSGEESRLAAEDDISTIKAANHRALHHTGAAAATAAAGKQFQSVALSGCSTIFDEAGASLASSVDPELWGRSFQESGLILEDDEVEVPWGARNSSNSQSPPCAPKLRPSLAPGLLPALSLPPARGPSTEGQRQGPEKSARRGGSLNCGPSPMLLSAFAHLQQPDDFKVAGAEILFEDSEEDDDVDVFGFGGAAEAMFSSEEDGDEDEDDDEEGVFAFQDEDDDDLDAGSLNSGSQGDLGC